MKPGDVEARRAHEARAIHEAALKEVLESLGEAALKAPMGRAILSECLDLARLLMAKNAAYGNSALQPVRIFSKASGEEQILVRIDDKLSRLARGSAAGEDVIQDLMGYLVLLRIAMRSQEPKP